MRILTRPLTLAVFVYVVAMLIIAPWGNYPLGDDWQYARVARTFSETGTFKIDPPVAPALMGQVLLSQPVIKVFGFSHQALRILTMTMALLILIFINKILQLLQVNPILRSLALLLIIFNPLFLYLATTYYSEMYGFALAFFTTYWWLRGRERSALAADKKEAVFIDWPTALICGFLGGITFWTRQYAAIAFPILVLAALITDVRHRRWQGMKRAWPQVLVATIIFVTFCQTYIPWAKWSGNFTPNFAGPVRELTKFLWWPWRVHVPIFIMHMTFYLLPVLSLIYFIKKRPRFSWIFALLWAPAILYGLYYLREIGQHHSVVGAWFTKMFPYIGNNMKFGSIGAITTTDVFHLNLDHPTLPIKLWRGISIFLFFASFLWQPLAGMLRDNLQDRSTSHLKQEAMTFFVLFALLSAALVIQGNKMGVFDRYYFPSVISLAVAAFILLNAYTSEFLTKSKTRALWVFAIVGLPVAYYAFAGVHDQFRWNDARWELYRGITDQGISPLVIDNGYEGSWENYDLYRRDNSKNHHLCIEKCKCHAGWFCFDDSYRIGMNIFDGYQEIASIQPSYWLVPDGPALYSSKRVPGTTP